MRCTRTRGGRVPFLRRGPRETASATYRDLPRAPEPDRIALLRRVGAGIRREDAGARLVDKAAAAIERAREAERAGLLAGEARRSGSAQATGIASERGRPVRAADRAIGPIADP